VRSAVDWFLGLNLAKKALAVLFAALLLFSLVYLLTTTVLYLRYGEQSHSSMEKDTAPNTASPGSSNASASAAAPAPDNNLTISGARWEGEKAVVEGTWKGDISSVHCDLMQGGDQGRATDWWDRGVPTHMSWSDRTFEQDFVKAEGRKIEDPIDPTSRYTMVCSGQFSGGWSVSDSATVEGTPPG
jgi:hypothetical protein